MPLKPFFDAFDYDRPKAVVWLVPSITILEQTIRNLKDTSHPYRQKINSHFGNKVEVFDKSALLHGSGFNATSVKEQLNIFVLSFDSIINEIKGIDLMSKECEVRYIITINALKEGWDCPFAYIELCFV